jgi:hypothetical protein
LTRLRAGDEAGVAELLERREGVLHALSGWSRDTGTELMESARRAVAQDTALAQLPQFEGVRVAVSGS